MAKILVLDFNTQANYPDLSIAYLVTPLRAAGYVVEVKTFSIKAQLRSKNSATQPELDLTNIQKYLEKSKPMLILIPSYLKHYPAIQALASVAEAQQLPLILGGACLSSCGSEDLPLWLKISGVSAVFMGQADWVIADLVESVLRKQDLSIWPGVYQAGLEGSSAPPLQELDLLPIPDLSDFAWQSHSTALIPVLTGRISSNEEQKQIYGSRPVNTVLDELYVQAARYQRKQFIFLDSRLNTNLAMWHGLIDNIQALLPESRWIATVDLDGQHAGLDLGTLVAARAAGLRHLNISLETTQALKQGKLLKATIERNRELVANAYQAGLSVRCLASNADGSTNLTDFPNTHDFVLRKLVETEQARQVKNSQQKQEPSKISKTIKAETTKTKIPTKANNQQSNTKKPSKSLWQFFKKQPAINKTNESNQLV